MTPLEIGLVVGGGVLIVILIAVCIVLAKKVRFRNSDKVKIVDGVRMTAHDKTREGGSVKVSLNPGDVVLGKGVVYKADKKGKLLPGKYTALSADGSETFNLRVGGVVREFAHEADIVVGEGEEICAVSHTVILR